MTNPLWSLCHATARLPWGWRSAYDAWKANCSDWSHVEYVLGVDHADADKFVEPFRQMDVLGAGIKVAWNHGRQCAVDGWNATGRVSTGRFLITVADDLFPPPQWDQELLTVLIRHGQKLFETPTMKFSDDALLELTLDQNLMIEVKSGTSPADDEWMRVQLHSFITRPWYERRGNFFDPRFEGMYADVWETQVARASGVMIDARHLTFQHRHWIGTAVPQDEIYSRQNSPERYDRGLAVLGDLRKEHGLA